MDFSEPSRRAPTENLLPMINVVFLLLIFFLMTAELAPPEPFPVAPPTAAEGEQADGPLTLYLNTAGEIGFRDVTGRDAAFAALAAARDERCALDDCATDPPQLLLRADGAAPAATLAALLPGLARLGFKHIDLVAVRP